MNSPFKKYSSFSRNMKNIERKLVAGYTSRKDLKDGGFTVTFRHEGGVEIRLPNVSLRDLLFQNRRQLLSNVYAFSQRSKSEALLRKLVYALYAQNIIDGGKSIIDIGSWISDNALVWSTYLEAGKGRVFAIDPSKENIAFGQMLAGLNGLENLSWHVAVCSDRAGGKLYYEGKLTHTMFNEEGRGTLSPLQTTTLDEIAGPEQRAAIGLVHVDVEGMELKVLGGAQQIFRESRPVVLFEQHIGKEDPRGIHALLKAFSYRLFMINEVLPDCELDCRNFMAVPEGMDISGIQNATTIEGRAEGIWYATPGDALIPVKMD